MKRPFPLHSNLVWPPPLLVILFVVIYGVFTTCVWFLDFTFFAKHGARIFETEDMVNVRKAILMGAAAVYALYRLWRFHPALNQSYAAWLKSSPWTAQKALPCGPIYPVWQDAVTVGVLSAIAYYHAQVNPMLPALAFGFTYVAGMTLLLVVTRQWWFCVSLGFLWPALMLVSNKEVWGIALIAAIITVLWLGHRASLKAFPWKPLPVFLRPGAPMLQMEIQIRIPGVSEVPATGTQTTIGWPFAALSPKVEPRSISPLTSFVVATLIGWWSFCIIKSSKMDPMPGVILFLTMTVSWIRVAIYASGLSAPFGLWGRIISGQLLVPRFDKILLAPLAAVLIAIVGGVIIRRSGSWYPTVESCVFGGIWFVLLSGGPKLQHWLLTGQHRFRPPSQLSSNMKILRPV